MSKYEAHGDWCPWHEHQRDADCRCSASRADRVAAASEAAFGNRATDDGHTYSNGTAGRAGNWMQTYSGRQFWPIDPRPDEVHLEDIAHALAHACRFAGHCERFYSVAEHSVLVSHLVPRELALVALLHDATEAYVVDIPRPLKPFLAGYKEIELRVWTAIAERFRLPLDMPSEVKAADNAVLLAEAEQIMKPHPAPWSVPGKPAKVKISCWNPIEADIRFRARFRELTKGVGVAA